MGTRMIPSPCHRVRNTLFAFLTVCARLRESCKSYGAILLAGDSYCIHIRMIFLINKNVHIAHSNSSTVGIKLLSKSCVSSPYPFFSSHPGVSASAASKFTW